MTQKTNIRRHVPFLLVKEWADKDGKVKTITREAEKFEEFEASRLFSDESVSVTDDCRMLSDVVFPDVLESLKKGNADDSLITMSAAVLLALELLNEDLIEQKELDYPSLPDIRKNILELDFPYLLDLRYCILETPPWCMFVLGDHPLYFVNMLGSEEKKYPDSLYRTGLILILPLTPYRALLLFDSSSYWLHGKEMTSDDVNLVNRYIMGQSHRSAVYLDETDEDSYPNSPEHFKYYYEDNGYISFPFSFLSVRPGAEDRAGRVRPLPEYLRQQEAWRWMTGPFHGRAEKLTVIVETAIKKLREEGGN